MKKVYSVSIHYDGTYRTTSNTVGNMDRNSLTEASGEALYRWIEEKHVTTGSGDFPDFLKEIEPTIRGAFAEINGMEEEEDVKEEQEDEDEDLLSDDAKSMTYGQRQSSMMLDGSTAPNMSLDHTLIPKDILNKHKVIGNGRMKMSCLLEAFFNKFGGIVNLDLIPGIC